MFSRLPRISEDMSDMERNLGYCPQEDALDPMLTAKEMIYCIARLKGIPEDDISEVSRARRIWPRLGCAIGFSTSYFSFYSHI